MIQILKSICVYSSKRIATSIKINTRVRGLQFVVLSFLLLVGPSVYSQDIEDIVNKVKNKDPLSISGTVSTGASFYGASGISDRRNPFAFYTSIAPTIKYRGFSFPFRFTYRDQKGSFSQPFQRIAINPTYKWLTVGIGNTTLDLNPYVFSGQYFKGISVQIKTDKFRFKSGYGDLENPLAQIDTIVSGTLILPSYKRKVFAALIGFGSGKNYIDITYFQAKDKTAKSDLAAIDTDLLLPQENLAIGIDVGHQLWKKFNIKAKGAASALTTSQDALVGPSTATENDIVRGLSNLMTYNISSKLHFAWDASFNYKSKRFGMGVQYKRVSPLYKTLGTYYFQEDYQNYTLKMNVSTPKNKIRLSGEGGIQSNNLNKLRESTRTRKIINTTLMLSPSRKFITTIRVSNFQSDRTPNFTRINDTLKFTQTTRNYSILPILMLGEKDIRTTISLMANFQRLVDLSMNLAGNGGIDNYTGNLSYGVANAKTDVNIVGNMMYNKNIAGLTENQRIGLNMTYAKKVMKKKMSLSGNLGFIKNKLNGIGNGFTITTSAGLRYRVKKKISCGLNGNILFRISEKSPYQEFRLTAKVSYQFRTK